MRAVCSGVSNARNAELGGGGGDDRLGSESDVSAGDLAVFEADVDSRQAVKVPAQRPLMTITSSVLSSLEGAKGERDRREIMFIELGLGR